MIWAHVIGSNFMIIRLNTEQLVAQHIPLLYIAAISFGASEWFHRTFLEGCCDTTDGRTPVQFA